MMQSVFEILQSLEDDSSRLTKESILTEHVANELLKRTFVASLDPYSNYFVTKFKTPPAVTLSNKNDDEVLSHFLDTTIVSLSTRQTVGNAARSMVEQDLASMTEVQQKWCSRILLKNLRCGVSETTVNKIWPNSVKKFAVALAETLEARWSDGRLVVTDDITYPVIVEPKLDGLRCIAVKSAGIVTLYTRNGTVLETLPTIKSALEAHPLDNIVFDGEAIGKDWNESASVIMSHKKSKGDANITYNVFDAVPLKSWIERSSISTFEDRRKFLEKLFIAGVPDGVKCLKLTDKLIAGSDGDILRFYEKCLARGYEGVMVKDPQATYAWKRSSAVLKLKPVSTFEGVVVGWHTGTAGSKRQNSFGGFSVLLSNGVSTAVGSGLDDKIREEVEKNGPDTYIGKIVECEAQSLTDDGKMRFPVFCRFRSENDVDPAILSAFEAWKRQA